jgi:hypothetical protein
VLNKPTPERILGAARIELERILKRLICCRNRQYRENGNYADDLAAAIARLEFVLRDLMTGLVSPVDVQAEAAAKLEQKHIQ